MRTGGPRRARRVRRARAHRRRGGPLVVAVALVVLAAACSWTGRPDAPPPVTGDVTPVQDPAVATEGGTTWVYSTGPGIPVRRSADLQSWTAAGRAFPDDVPAWAARLVPGADGVWAPDLSFFNDTWHLYYAVSTFGSRRSVIGQATASTLDPTAAGAGWTDRGLVLESYPGDLVNAIDPAVAVDVDGQPYLAWGSFGGGIALTPLDPATGVPLAGAPRTIVAARPDGKGIEAPYLVRHGTWWYLFVSFDQCCDGVHSTYNVRVGRSAAITGPYTDRDGRPMTEGNATPVVSTTGDVHGPGHEAVLLTPGTDWLAFHWYDARHDGRPTLGMVPVTWTRDDWPTVAAATVGRLTATTTTLLQ